MKQLSDLNMVTITKIKKHLKFSIFLKLQCREKNNKNSNTKNNQNQEELFSMIKIKVMNQ